MRKQDKVEQGRQDGETRRHTQVRGSMGSAPSGSERTGSTGSGEMGEMRERMRGSGSDSERPQRKPGRMPLPE
jgi:hypothetical protein